ncbi:predicted protein [Naegleria gruberi]|uniref:Predicted protein n=1 Tax=Naegleria gruberi TaxID=5762 RepID=D2VEK5_NAEGR|nr:uncharacterized protein NAEGRDRAFT_33383 [Naegleria gruberi]EFC44899.1 predicted protein [Naegleria gruberi]|eukprot:XP_002677643.1 predicted protein [Naegleria gruberi strain NEG-M]
MSQDDQTDVIDIKSEGKGEEKRTRINIIKGDPSRRKSNSLADQLKKILNFYKMLMEKYPPVAVKSITAALITFIANIVSQKFIKKKTEIDWNSVINFTITGGCSSACSHFWYGFLDNIMDYLKEIKSLRPIVCNPTIEKFALVPTLIDQAVYAPFINAFYIVVLAFVESRAFVVDKALANLKRDFYTTLKSGYMLWPLATIVVLSSSPPDLVVLFFNIIGFFWSLYLAKTL